MGRIPAVMVCSLVSAVLFSGCTYVEGLGERMNDEENQDKWWAGPPPEVTVEADPSAFVELTNITVTMTASEDYSYRASTCGDGWSFRVVDENDMILVRLYTYGEEPEHRMAVECEDTIPAGHESTTTVHWNGHTETAYDGHDHAPHEGERLPSGEYRVVGDHPGGMEVSLVVTLLPETG